MIGALIACILVLGFNYWVSSSRNLELQTKLYELEGQVRRGAAERGVAELKKNEFQEEIQRQKEQISHIESLYKRQLEGAQNTCSQEKVILQQNITSSTKTLQELKGQLNQLSDDLGKLQKELQSCQGNIKTLNNKLTYDMTHCNSQVLSQKELCDERVAAARLEVQKKMDKLIASQGVSSPLVNTVDGAIQTGADAVKTSPVNQTTTLALPKVKEPTELLTNEIIVDRDAPLNQALAKDATVPSATAGKQDILPPPGGAATTEEADAGNNKLLNNNLTEDKEMEVMDAHEESPAQTEADPGMEGMLLSQVKIDDSPGQKLDEQDEYDAEEQVVGGPDLEKQQQAKQAENIDKDMEEELADYNGDDENEGEFEADKQAELAQV